MYRIPLLISVISLKLVSCQTTEYSYNYTVTYNPPQECLPYDGSVVPDCSKYIDPTTKQPYYHEHSSSELLKLQFEYLTSHLPQTAAGSGSVGPTERPVCSSVLPARQSWAATPFVMDSGLSPST